MHLRLTLRRTETDSVDLAVTLDQGLTVGELAEELQRRDPGRLGPPLDGPVTLAIRTEGGELAALPAAAAVSRSGLGNGARVVLVPSPVAPAALAAEGPAVVVQVVAGPQQGTAVSLPRGRHVIGRHPSCDVHLADPRVSGRHANLVVDAVVEIVDNGSSNGVRIGGKRVSHAILGQGDEVRLGSTTLRVSRTEAAPSDGLIPFDRAPRVEAAYRGAMFMAPPPPALASWRPPLLVAAAPVLIGLVWFVVASNAVALLLALMSPVLLVASFVEFRLTNRPSRARASAEYLAEVTELDIALREAADRERGQRGDEHPGAAALVEAARDRSSLLWTRSPAHRSFLELRLGLGGQPSRNQVVMPLGGPGPLRHRLAEVVRRHSIVDNVPVVATPPLGVAGPAPLAAGVARSLLLQLAVLHSPAELSLSAIVDSANVGEWAWLKWLPHTRSLSTSALPSLASTGTCVLLVDDAAAVDRATLLPLVDEGVEVLWLASSADRLPAVCHTFIEVTSAEQASAGFVHAGEWVAPMRLEPIDVATAEAVARRLSPLVDTSVPPPASWSGGEALEITELPFGPGPVWPAP